MYKKHALPGGAGSLLKNEREALVTTTVEGEAGVSSLADGHLRLEDQRDTLSHLMVSPVPLAHFCRMRNKPYVSILFIKQLWQSVSVNLYPC